MMVVAASTTPNLKATPTPRSHSNPKRPPLLPSERENNVARRPKSRDVNSRYLSTSSSTSTSGSSSSTLSNSSYFSSSRRCPSPIPGRTPAPATPNLSSIKRSQSTERGRPGNPKLSGPRIGGDMSAAAKLLVSSTRSLSVSFQGESFAVPKSKALKPAPSPSLGKGKSDRKRASSPTPAVATTTPRKGGNQGENARPFEHHPWPGRSRPVVTSLSKSVDLGCAGKKLINGSAKVVRALQESLNGDGNRASSDDKVHRSMSGGELVKGLDAGDASCVNGSSLGSETLVSDTESASSECNSGSQDSNTCSSAPRSKGGGRSIVVPARFWREGNSLLTRPLEPGSPMARSNSFRGTGPPKLFVPKKLVNDSPGVSPRGTVSSRGFSSPLRGSVRPASPSRPRASVASEKCSPSRGMASPSRARNASAGVFAKSVTSTPSVLSFGAEVRRVKVGDNRLGDAHLLRLLHNRHLQWRIVNARAEASLFSQKTNAERSIYNAWRKMSDLRGAVSSKRKELQWQRQNLKLVSILKGQMLYLEEWALMDKDLCSSLSGATESLKASIIRLPVVGGARADIHDMKEVICSAADVMHAMASSICSLLSKVEEANALVAEVAGLTLKEHSLLNECKEILSTLAALQVRDCSLRAHVLQLKCAPSNLTVEA